MAVAFAPAFLPLPVLARTVLLLTAAVLALAAAEVAAEVAAAALVLLAAPLLVFPPLLAFPPLLKPPLPPNLPKAAAAKASPANKGTTRMRDVKAVENFIALLCVEKD